MNSSRDWPTLASGTRISGQGPPGGDRRARKIDDHATFILNAPEAGAIDVILKPRVGIAGHLIPEDRSGTAL